MTKSKSFNKSQKNRALCNSLLESILEDEEAMDEGVAENSKKRKPDDADKDEGPSAGSDQGQLFKVSKSGKSAKDQVEESIFVQDSDYAEHDDIDMPRDQGENLGMISINRGPIKAIPISLPPQPVGEATKASSLRRIPLGVQGRSNFIYFLYLIVQNTNPVGCQICEGPHLDKDCPLNEEVKQVEEVRYVEFGRITPFNGSNGGNFYVGPPGYYTKIDNHPPYAERRQSQKELLAKHQEESAQRSTEMKEDKSEQAKVVTVKNEGPDYSKKLKNLHGISFLSDSQEENIIDQLPTKESNPGHFTLPCTIGNFNFYAMADLGASVNVLPRNIFEYLELTNLSKIEMLVEMADMRKKAPLGIVRDILVKIDKFLFPSNLVILDQTPNSTVILGRPFLATVHAQISVFEKEISVGIGDERVEDSVWSKRYSEWCNENSHDKKPRPRDYTFKEWVKLKKGHLDISKSVRKDLFRLWVIDKSTEALDPDEDPFGRCLDEYNWVFPKEIEQLADEYEVKIREKGQVLKEIWTKCKRARSEDKDWWYDYWYENEEKTELGNEDYNPPIVHTKTYEVTKYKFNNGYSFICVSGKSNETLSLGRKNGSRFKKMIMEEMEETLRDDGEDSIDET
ncbi:zinc knuckle CX2CX4HX4C containing protein [Tanacetum coccineum]